FNNGDTLTSIENGDYMTSIPSNASNTQVSSASREKEQELRKQLEEEMRRTDDLVKERNQLYDKIDELSRASLALERLQDEYRKYQVTAQEEISEYVEAAKAISNEVILLAAQNSRLEQRMEELQAELRQRTHEIELLSQVNVIQTRQLQSGPSPVDQP
ncbi:sensor histidine kinase/response regulator, partial [Reticulomyxa filosa]